MRTALAFALFGVSLLAQQTGQQPVFRATVELVQIDVVVRDKDGNPLHDLTADDFVILDRRKRQNVATFKAVRRDPDASPKSGLSLLPASVRMDVASNQASDSDRLVVIVFDDLHGYRGRDETVKDIARKVVHELGSGSSIALVTTSGNQRVEVTRDRSRLLEAIDRFKGYRAERRPWLAPDNRGVRGVVVSATHDFIVSNNDEMRLQTFDANMQLYGTLKNVARLLSGSDGRRKAFVLISENIAKDLTGVFSTRAPRPDMLPSASGYFLSGSMEELAAARPGPPPYHDLAILEMMEAMQRGNVATYSIDPRGHVSQEKLMLECSPWTQFGDDPCLGGTLPNWNAFVRQAQHGLGILSEGSGGFAVVNTNDFTGGIGRILSDLDNYYLLGFYPEDTRSKGYRRLEVQVRGRPDVMLRYRRGYQIGASRDQEKKDVEPVVALATGALPDAGVPMRLHAVALPGSGSQARVPIALELTVPRKDLQESDTRLLDEIRYSILVVDLKGNKVKQRSGHGARMVLRPRDSRLAPPENVTYQIGLTMDLPPGRYQLRGSVLSSKLARGGSVFLPLDVPDFDKAPLALSGIVVGYAGGPRIPVATTYAPARRGMPPPQAFPRLPFPPSLDREFTLDDHVALYFEIARPDRRHELSATVAALDATGRVVREYRQKLPADSNGKVTFGLPLKELGPGGYRVRVSITDGKNIAESDVGIVVR